MAHLRICMDSPTPRSHVDIAPGASWAAAWPTGIRAAAPATTYREFPAGLNHVKQSLAHDREIGTWLHCNTALDMQSGRIRRDR
jgi:hypothetical protein